MIQIVVEVSTRTISFQVLFYIKAGGVGGAKMLLHCGRGFMVGVTKQIHCKGNVMLRTSKLSHSLHDMMLELRSSYKTPYLKLLENWVII